MTDTMDITDAEIDAVLDPESPMDPDAPFGRFKNGKPRKRPVPSSVILSVPAPKRTPPKPPKAARKGEPDYVQMTRNVLQLPVLALTLGGQLVQRAGREQLGSALQVDAMTIGLMTDELAAEGATLALGDPKAARFLEKYGKGGIYGNLIALGLTLGAQCMVNHGRMAPQPALGLVHPQEIVDRAAAAAGVPEEASDAVPAG
jgi:hypothetical protein